MSNHCIIIAEAGVNHGGDIAVAMRMIEEAARAGADYVKFQTFTARNLVCADADRAEYQKANCGGEESQLEMLERLELTREDFSTLAAHCRACGIGFLSSPFDLESVRILASIGMDFWKIPSGEITNLPLLEDIARQSGNIILSTGMCSMDEIGRAIDILEKNGTPKTHITLLHCNTMYPTPMSDVNLRAMSTLHTFGCKGVGFSDHTVGIEAAIAAVALGATVIEKHFTLSKDASGPDHRASADVRELKSLVTAVRNIEQALGTESKHVTMSERPNIAVARKSIVAAREIEAGEIFTEENLTTRRPGTGISPMEWHSVIGTAATRHYGPDELITL